MFSFTGPVTLSAQPTAQGDYWTAKMNGNSHVCCLGSEKAMDKCNK